MSNTTYHFRVEIHSADGEVLDIVESNDVKLIVREGRSLVRYWARHGRPDVVAVYTGV